MKTIPPPCPEPETGRKYWRSLDELAETPEFRQWVEREFPAGASELSDPVSRRHFVKIMSASFLLAGVGLTGCRRPVEHIYPFAKMPEDYVHGVSKYYATAMPTRGGAIPLLVRSHEGRPVKIEGNPSYPDGNGGTDAFAQASILNLYDPDRAQRFTRSGNATTRNAALDFLASVSRQFSANGGDGLCFLLEQSNSPSRVRLQNLLMEKFARARWFVYEPADAGVEGQAATAAFNNPAAGQGGNPAQRLAPYYRPDQARVILTLDSDLLGSEQDNYRLIRDFAKGRKIEKPGDQLNRLYAVEALMTLTGANADHRLRVPSGAVAQVAAQLATAVLGQAASQGSGAFTDGLNRLGQAPNVRPEWIRECAKDLAANQGSSLIVAGHRQPLAVHVIAQALNAALGNVGKTVLYRSWPEPKSGNITELAQALNSNQVDTLVILGGNPAYASPADLDWAKTQRKAKTVIRLGYYEDETFAGSDWHLPAAHYLESWGDARSSDGTIVPVQPLIEPLFGGVTDVEVLARLGGFERTSPYEIVRETFRGNGSEAEAEARWKRFLHDGFLADSALTPVDAKVDWGRAAQALGSAGPTPTPSQDSLEVVFHRDYSLDDGRYNNNGWLQELPDPVTKMVWENVILMSKKTADDHQLAIQDRENNNLQVPVVKVTLGNREIEGPAWVQPGMADNVLGLALGYGRTATGRVGKGSGYNAYLLRTSTAAWTGEGAKLSSTGRWHKLSTTQNHWAMEGRPIVREANLEQYRKLPTFAKAMNMHEPPGPRDEHGHPLPLYPNPLDVPEADGRTMREKATHAWGMSIDLNACVGCSACVIACQSENNVPIVGKDLVSRNREMHWLRIDRYYAGTVQDPQVVNQPMLCQHCESAPCENVCPVNATVHDQEGLNLMAYNRCVGTRYCSNNCPYKVRRFNYLDYNRRPLDELVGPFYSSPLTRFKGGEWDMIRWFKDPDRTYKPEDEWELLKLVKNPDVTVRMRGVMEKCTFCVQRIESAKIAQKVKAGPTGDIEVPDGTFTTACAQACPAGAIVFGNLKDPNSRVSKLKAQERDYSVLEFLQTKPRLTYLARVRNPNPAMPDYSEAPASLMEWEQRGNKLEGHAAHPAGADAHGQPGVEKKGGH